MSESTKKKKNLQSKLKSYSTIALSAIAAEGSAQVIYTDIRDTTLINNGDFFDIDLNSDGINDLSISLDKSVYSTSYSSTYIYVNYGSIDANGASSNSVNTVLNSTYSINEVVALNRNQSINNSLNNWSSYGYIGAYASVIYATASSTSSYSLGFGQFQGQGDKYLGVKFNIGANVHYGWVRLDVPASNNSVTIKDFAYDTTANAAILAGDTGISVGINEVNKSQANFYSQENRLLFKEGNLQTAEIRIYDLKGQLIERRRLLANQKELLLKKEYQGIYIVEVNEGESVFRKKLWLDSPK